MQRQSNTSRSVELLSDEMKIDESTVLPLFRRQSGDVKRGISKSRCSPEMKVKVIIPTVLILCIFILWWSSYPVKLEMKNGRMVGAYREMVGNELQNTYLANLASIFTPYPSISQTGGQ